MRVAFVGKGGAGKSSVAGLFARTLAARGEPVLALDSDPMPGLAYSLGIPPSDSGIPEEAVEENPDEDGPRYRLRDGLTPEEAVERYAATGPDGVRFLQFGKLRGHASTTRLSQIAFRTITRELSDERWHLVGDLPAGTRQAFFGWGSFARTVFVVAEPTAKSLLSARRLARLANDEDAPRLWAIANRVDDGDAELVARRTGLEVIAALPHDEALARADRRGEALADGSGDGPVARAVASIVERLLEEEAKR